MCALEKRGNLFILTLNGDDQHRLNPNVINSLLDTLSQAKAQSTRGSALVTVAHGKFFSNGLDLDCVQSAESKQVALERLVGMVRSFKLVVAALLSLPMPTVAAVTGHASAAGFVLALSHDYVFMRQDREVLYLSELDIGVTIPNYFHALLEEKIGSTSARRDIVLAALKMKGEEAEKRSIGEAAYDGEDQVRDASLRMAEDLAKRKWDGEVYAEIRKRLLHPKLCGMLRLATQVITSPRH